MMSKSRIDSIQERVTEAKKTIQPESLWDDIQFLLDEVNRLDDLGEETAERMGYWKENFFFAKKRIEKLRKAMEIASQAESPHDMLDYINDALKEDDPNG